MTLKELRKKKRLLIKDVAAALNVTSGAVVFWEKGERKCSVDTLIKLAKLYHVSMENITAAYLKTQKGA